MKLNDKYDITPAVIDPKTPEEKIEVHMPGVRGDTGVWNEYGFAVAAEVGKRVSPGLVRRMDNEVLRNLAQFAQKSPDLDLSKVQLVEGPKMPTNAANNDWARYNTTTEQREASRATATRFTYTRGWYVQAQEPTDG